jgi:hypothetical protein
MNRAKNSIGTKSSVPVLATLICAAAFSPLIPSVHAQDFVLDTYYDCAKATNGKAYCRQVGKGSGYFPISDDFLERFVALKSGNSSSAPVATARQNPNTTSTNTVAIQKLTADASEIRGLLDLYGKMIAEQKQVTAQEGGAAGAAAQAIAILNARIAELQQQFKEKTTELSTYQTSVRPNTLTCVFLRGRPRNCFRRFRGIFPAHPRLANFG